MRLTAIYARDILPIRRFEVESLSDVVVFAGRNGVGKTRLLDGLVNVFRNPSAYPQVRLTIEATCDGEKSRWGKPTLDTADIADAQRLVQTLQQNRRRADWTSSVVRFESDRSIQQIQPFTFNWDYSDPFQENTGWDFTLQGLRNRLQDTIHSLFRKMRSHRESIAREAEALRKEGQSHMALDWPDPMAAFKAAFSQLLAPKQLVDPDAQRQQLEYDVEGQRFPISSLSSGEREVLNIVFDFLLRKPQDSIVFFDEPELHLHPELSYRLLQTLRATGARNQFVFATHSPDIITASLDQSVVFISPWRDDGSNQAVPVRPDDETNEALTLLGQSIGIVALGRKLVLIEGTSSSIDKQTYGSILENRFPELVLVPTGGRGFITSFERLQGAVLSRSIWGVQFFMLCDGDGFAAAHADPEHESQGRLCRLPRYHLENFFLDEHVIAAAFASLEPASSWLRNPEAINDWLREIARGHVAYATALVASAKLRAQVGNVDIMPDGLTGISVDELTTKFVERANEEANRVTRELFPDAITSLVHTTFQQIQSSLEAPGDEWKKVIPGKPVFNVFAQKTGLRSTRLKTAYIGVAASQRPGPFDEIVSIFERFNSMT